MVCELLRSKRSALAQGVTPGPHPEASLSSARRGGKEGLWKGGVLCFSLEPPSRSFRLSLNVPSPRFLRLCP